MNDRPSVVSVPLSGPWSDRVTSAPNTPNWSTPKSAPPAADFHPSRSPVALLRNGALLAALHDLAGVGRAGDGEVAQLQPTGRLGDAVDSGDGGHVGLVQGAEAVQDQRAAVLFLALLGVELEARRLAPAALALPGKGGLAGHGHVGAEPVPRAQHLVLGALHPGGAGVHDHDEGDAEGQAGGDHELRPAASAQLPAQIGEDHAGDGRRRP
ncbi:hypothetical protein [Streptomyces litchfieldiae]|uniref:Uncharacterized protein n=1 Tax=Streptomyces litchfieldiae TaxID=3075543 RepID=A0ABU2ML19_9ACTN|nr:hypothetical protein [Streptomyces sp. DSM 44938]MDT0342307.1 hypothetical protein [Streptomyces sp. DSM 44938]